MPPSKGGKSGRPHKPLDQRKTDVRRYKEMKSCPMCKKMMHIRKLICSCGFQNVLTHCFTDMRLESTQILFYCEVRGKRIANSLFSNVLRIVGEQVLQMINTCDLTETPFYELFQPADENTTTHRQQLPSPLVQAEPVDDLDWDLVEETTGDVSTTGGVGKDLAEPRQVDFGRDDSANK